MHKVSEIQIVPVKPVNGLIAFVSCVFDDSFYFSSIALYSRPQGGFRLVFPQLKGINTFYPISKEIGDLLEQEIGGKYIHRFR